MLQHVTAQDGVPCKTLSKLQDNELFVAKSVCSDKATFHLLRYVKQHD
jgi:hypothetical protein